MTAAPPEDRLAQLLAVLEARTKLLAFFFGLCFVAALLVLAVWFPQPTTFQYTVFRIVLALAAAGVAGVIPGMIRLKAQPGTALLIHAGGALAVFVMVYLPAPAALPQDQSALPSPSQSRKKKSALAAQPLKISGVDTIENGVHILNFTPTLTRHTVRLSNIGEAPVHISLIGFPEKYFYTNLADEKSLFQGHKDRDMSVILMFNVPEQQEYIFEVSDSAGGTARVAVRIKEGWKEYIAQQIQKIDDKLEQGTNVLELYNTAKQVIAYSGYKELSAPLQEMFAGQLLEAAKQPEAAAMAYAKSKKEFAGIVMKFTENSSPAVKNALADIKPCTQVYTFSPPATYDGDECIRMCYRVRSKCVVDQKLKQETCERYNQMAWLEFGRCIASGATNCYNSVQANECIPPDEEQCENKFQYCYKGCGGNVTISCEEQKTAQ